MTDTDNTVVQISSTPKLAAGSIINNTYRLLVELGGGGMGTVYKAEHLPEKEAGHRDHVRAIKILGADFRNQPDAWKQLVTEGAVARRIRHPNIIAIYELSQDNNTKQYFMTMEYLEGMDLGKLLASHSLPTTEHIFNIINQVGNALQYLHTQCERPLIHSDIKPGNIFICRDDTVKLLDFGISRHTRQSAGDVSLVNPGEHAPGGTPRYASPEQLEHCDPHPCDDVFSLACVSYLLLSGKQYPFGEATSTLVARTKKITPKRIPGLTDSQWSALAKGLSLDRNTRTASVREFIEGLTASVSTKHPEVKIPVTQVWVAATVITLTGVVAAGLWLFHEPASENPESSCNTLTTDIATFPATTDYPGEWIGKARQIRSCLDQHPEQLTSSLQDSLAQKVALLLDTCKQASPEQQQAFIELAETLNHNPVMQPRQQCLPPPPPSVKCDTALGALQVDLHDAPLNADNVLNHSSVTRLCLDKSQDDYSTVVNKVVTDLLKQVKLAGSSSRNISASIATAEKLVQAVMRLDRTGQWTAQLTEYSNTVAQLKATYQTFIDLVQTSQTAISPDGFTLTSSRDATTLTLKITSRQPISGVITVLVFENDTIVHLDIPVQRPVREVKLPFPWHPDSSGIPVRTWFLLATGPETRAATSLSNSDILTQWITLLQKHQHEQSQWIGMVSTDS